jgi:2-oxoglutarate dehydrogenase E2 component (dihydrolipoamide succinyltransferase)
MAVELKVPSLGESITEVMVGAWYKKEGELVARDEAVVEIETDKTTVDLPAPVPGVVTKILKKQGDMAEVGEVVGYVEEQGSASVSSKGQKDEEAEAEAQSESETDDEREETPAAKKDADSKEVTAKTKPSEPEKKPAKKPAKKTESKPESEPAPAKAARTKTEAPSEPADERGGQVVVMPAARRLMAEKGLSPDDVHGTGPGGRILKEDVLRHAGEAKSAGSEAAPAPEPPREAPAAASSIAEGRQEEVVPMTLLRRRIAERLVQSQQTSALLTTFNEIDMSTLKALRAEYQPHFTERYGIKLGFMSFFVKAAVDALKLVPEVNAQVREHEIVYRNYFDVGVAVGGGRGLVVPVIRNAERLSFSEIELTIADFAQRAKNNTLQVEELQGGTFTISNGGIYGSLLSTPIVNPPQSGILGMHAIQDRAVVVDGEVVVRPMMYVALTYDHRIIDGREAVTFLKRVKECIEQPARMLLEV